jgi:hypothetical protein
MNRSLPALLAGLCLCFAVAPASASDVLLPRGADWLYLDDGSDQGSAWRAPAFPDGTWDEGPAPLGYGDNGEVTTLDFGGDPDNKFTTTYFRRHFDVLNPAAYTDVILHFRRDDGIIVFLNGTQLISHNMPGGIPSYTTFASSTVSAADEYNYFSIDVDPALLVAGDNVLAVELHQRSLTSSDLTFDLSVEAGTLPFVNRGPYLQQKTPSSTVVAWRTMVATTGRVRYGPSPGNLTSFVDSAVTTLKHEVTLTGFTPGQTVYYSVGTQTDPLVGDDSDHVFSTSPVVGSTDPFRIWVLGDSGEADANAEAVRDAYTTWTGATPTDVWLMLGDNAYDDGTASQYQAAVFDRYPELLRTTAVWPARGNHDKSLFTFWDLFAIPKNGEAGGVPSLIESYYSFDYGNVHFVCLDSEGSSTATNGPMYQWLAADLAATDQDWIIAFWHHPPYTKGSHDSDTESDPIKMRNDIVPLLEDHGVDLVLCGHSHSYERSMLIDGHYGLSTTFGPEHQRDAGDGDPAGDGVYDKASLPHQGTVYAVPGSGSKITNEGPLTHPIMTYDDHMLGSLVIDVAGDVLTGTFVTELGTVDDTFTLVRHESWDDLGNGLAGASGVPLLEGDGPLVADKPVGLVLTDGLSSSVAALVLGLSQVNVPIKGGVLVPAPDIVYFGLPLDVSGGLALFGTWPNTIPPGTESFYQYWITDPAGPKGFSASNGLRAEAQ